MEPPTAGKPASAIPRLSKLPLPKSRAPQPEPQPDVSPPAKSTIGTPRLAKRASSATLSQPSLKPAAASTPSKPNGVRLVAKPSINNLASRPKSQKRPAGSSTGRSNLNRENVEANDRLSSLSSFRSASGQDLRCSSGEEPPPTKADFDTADLPSDARGRKASRPSLSDRTIESLHNVPTTPKDRRRSSFFNPVESPMGPPPRPDSSLSRNGSRPGTSDGVFTKQLSRPASPGKKAPISAQPPSRTASRVPSISSTAANRRSISATFVSKLQGARTASPAKSSALTQPHGHGTKSLVGSKTLASRPSKQRLALGDAFVPTKPEDPDEPKRVVSNSSAALRQQIAAAKAAAKAQKAVMHDSPQEFVGTGIDGNFNAQTHVDPFNQAPKDDKHILRNRINAARMSGKLNIAAMGLKQIPEEVRKMYNPASMEESKVNWAEVVDLTRLIVADNDIAELDSTFFSDLTTDELAADDQTEGNQFGGLELLDLHGNSLSTIPLGLRRLERLTSLNLAHNKLDNAAFDIICQIKSLRELKLGNNSLTGNVPASLCEMPHLEVLDLQANRLLGLPEALRELVSLKVLNVAGNQLTAMPMEALQQLPLTELDASSNALIASLFPLGGPSGHPTLQSLNVSNNSLAALAFTEPLELPQLRVLDVTNNHLTVLPAVTGWTELITLAVGDNKLADFPVGFCSLKKLRNANFTGNDIRLVDLEICKLDSLEFLILSSNPLRERKFLTMSAADIKRDLRARLAPEPDEDSTDMEEPSSPVTVIGDSDRDPPLWAIKGNGLLDLASKSLSDDLNDTLGSFLNSNEVKQIHLHSNKLSCVPPALWMGQDLRYLDLSDNTLSVDYLSDELLLPALQELNISKCRLSSLEPLMIHLQAPNLQTLQVSANRISGALPALRSAYPRLAILFANDNKITSISADALRGLHTVNLTSNEIQQLPAEVGLLWDEGLKILEIASNAFRVPNYRILDKGTEAVLRWLMNRLPVNQGAQVEELD